MERLGICQNLDEAAARVKMRCGESERGAKAFVNV
jgi:hypothetical protein